MLSLDDKRWNNMLGGYRMPYDPRPAFAKLQSGTDISNAWEELWGDLHHQGDVNEASYASVPHLVRIYHERPTADWNTYGIVGVIELARKSGKNPDVPSWLAEDYFKAIQELAKIGLAEIPKTNDPDVVRAILGVIALAKGARNHANFLVNYTDDEVLEIETEWLNRP